MASKSSIVIRDRKKKLSDLYNTIILGPNVLNHLGVLIRDFFKIKFDPHYTDAVATVERNIETRGGEGEFY